jgi:S-layer homology domain
MTANIRKRYSALLALLGALLIALGIWANWGNTSTVARASAPVGNAPSGVTAATWSTPDLITYIGEYDGYSGVAASDANGSIQAIWAAAPDDSTGLLYGAANAGFAQETFPTEINDNGVNQINCKNQFGPCSVAIDNQQRRHIMYWTYRGSTLCLHYARLKVDGHVDVDEELPSSCEGGVPRKLLALAIDQNNTVHMVASRDNMLVTRYWQRLDNGVYNAIREDVPQPCGYTGDLTMAMSTNGVLMVAFKDCGISGSGTDIWTATRQAPNNWTLEDISAPCCSETCPSHSNAYLPNLAAAPDGGMRISWADGRCPGSDSAQANIYYREWNPPTGWENQPIVRVVNNSGSSYHNAITVDSSGEAHIVWADTTSSPIGYYRTFYSHGRGTNFTPVELPFDAWGGGGGWQRDVAIDYGFGYVHVLFSTVRTDPKKDNYYSYAQAAAQPPCLLNPGTDFQDVCAGSTFHAYAHNMYVAGIMTGYACGSPTEPCGPDNKPYFRVNNTTTRGQMSKIVVLGAGLPLVTPSTNTFEDVPVGHTFFDFVETAAANGVIGGYPCGGPGEPCGQGNKPYYRPSANVTRGQLTKMVSVAFNFTEPVSGQTFEDVPTSSPFYEFVQRLSARDIILGYACGGPGEPCNGPGNRPYFRTGNSVTRGQTAKIVDLSRNQPDATPTSTATPEPTNTPFPTNTPEPPTATHTAQLIPTITLTITPPIELTATSTSTTIPRRVRK